MSRNAIYVRVLLVIVSIVVLLAFINRNPQHELSDTWLPSSYNPVGAGSMAFYRTLEDLHWPVERWREPLSRLNSYGTGNVLVITRAHEGARVSFTEQEIDLLDDWVQQGNTLLLLGAADDTDDMRGFLKQFGFTLPKKDDSVTDLFQSFVPNGSQTVDLQRPNAESTATLTVPRSFLLPPGAPADAKVLWHASGQPYVMEIPRGKGRVICGASPLILSSRSLQHPENLAEVMSWLQSGGHVPGHVFFEESHHGYSNVYAVARLLNDRGVRFAGMLALLGALAFLGSSLVRFGQVVPLRRDSGRSALEFVDSIADLYLRADLRNDTVKYLFVETHQRILQRLNLPPTAPHDVIAKRLEQAHPHLPKWKKLAQRFDSPDYTDGLPPTGWLKVARDLIQIKSAMA